MTPEEAIPERRPMPEGAFMVHWTIYDHPKDYPDGYVLRAQFIMKDNSVRPDAIAWYADHPDKLRAIVPRDKVCLMRMPEDDPVILETWI